MAFNPTHTFRGIELRYEYDYDNGSAWYSDQFGQSFNLLKKYVSQILLIPRPGEIWVNTSAEEKVNRIVNRDGDLCDLHGNIMLHHSSCKSPWLDEYEKVMNADGTFYA